MKFINGFLWEVIALIWYSTASLVGSVLPYQPKSTKGKKTIVIVHGFMGRSLPFLFLSKFLQKRGYTVVFADFGFHIDDVEQVAVKLQKFLEDKEQILLIGISTGAVISLYYLQQLEGWEHVDHFIAIAGCFQGNFFARFFPFAKGVRQIQKGSSFLRSLTKNIVHPKKITTLEAKYDEITPLSSAILKGANNILLEEVGHGYFQLFSQRMMQEMEKVIESYV